MRVFFGLSLLIEYYRTYSLIYIYILATVVFIYTHGTGKIKFDIYITSQQFHVKQINLQPIKHTLFSCNCLLDKPTCQANTLVHIHTSIYFHFITVIYICYSYSCQNA